MFLIKYHGRVFLQFVTPKFKSRIWNLSTRVHNINVFEIFFCSKKGELQLENVWIFAARNEINE